MESEIRYLTNVFGGTGFIGSRYRKMFIDSFHNERHDRYVKSPEVLYMISTTDNYSVHTDVFVDIDTNLNILMEILESFRTYQLKNPQLVCVFNFISSWFVYGKTPLPAKEDYACDPKGFYSITKRCAEQLLMSYCDTFGLNYRIMRLANVLGKSDKGVSKKKNALQYMINLLMFDKPVDLYDGGTMMRDYIYVDDACRAINHVMKNGRLNEIINIGSGKPTLICNAIDYARQKLNSKSRINNIETAEFHKVVQTTDMVLDTSKLKALGFELEYKSIESIIDKLLE